MSKLTCMHDIILISKGYTTSVQLDEKHQIKSITVKDPVLVIYAGRPDRIEYKDVILNTTAQLHKFIIDRE